MRIGAVLRSIVCFAAVPCGGLGATVAAALAASPATDADAALRRGVELRRRGDDAQALVEFQRAFALVASSRALAQIGFAEQALGRWRDAEEHLEQALAGASDAWIQKNRATLLKSRAAVGAHLGSLEVLGAPPGAELRVEGRVVGVLPLARPVRVAAGTVGVEVRAEGYLAASRSTTIAVGELTRETMSLTKIDPPPAPSPRSPPALARSLSPPLARSPLGDPRASPPSLHVGQVGIDGSEKEGEGGGGRPAAWITAGGAAFFAGGLVVALVKRSHYAGIVTAHQADATCAQAGDRFTGVGAPACAAAATNRDQATILAKVSGGLAGALALTSALLFMTAPSAPDRRIACAPGAPDPFVACALTF
jgi:hypothetical protein